MRRLSGQRPTLSTDSRIGRVDGAARMGHRMSSTNERTPAPRSFASDELVSRVYSDLRACAATLLSREFAAQTLQPTALVHEAYLRVARMGSEKWETQRHFFAAAAEAMRRILIERARQRRRIRHGRGWRRTLLPPDSTPDREDHAREFLLDRLLLELAESHSRAAGVTQLRFLLGLTIEETAAVLELSPATVKVDWAFARSWIRRKLDGGVEARL